jgi:hypothetical protein
MEAKIIGQCCPKMMSGRLMMIFEGADRTRKLKIEN